MHSAVAYRLCLVFFGVTGYVLILSLQWVFFFFFPIPGNFFATLARTAAFWAGEPR